MENKEELFTLFELWDIYKPKSAIFMNTKGYYLRIDIDPKEQEFKTGYIYGYWSKYKTRLEYDDTSYLSLNTVWGQSNKIWKLIKILK